MAIVQSMGFGTFIFLHFCPKTEMILWGYFHRRKTEAFMEPTLVQKGSGGVIHFFRYVISPFKESESMCSSVCPCERGVQRFIHWGSDKRVPCLVVSFSVFFPARFFNRLSVCNRVQLYLAA